MPTIHSEPGTAQPGEGRRAAAAPLLLRRPLKPEPGVVPRVRRAVADVLGTLGLESWPATLLVSELAANAVYHGRTDFELRITAGEFIRVEIRDSGRDLPARRKVDLDSERGRGLHLLDNLATAWGVEPRRRGKTVWFEVARVPAS